MSASSRVGNVTVFVFDKNQPSLPAPFHFVLVSVISAFTTLSTVYHSNSPLSHSVVPVLFLPDWSFQLTIYLFMRISLSPDIILCGWPGLKQQLTNYAPSKMSPQDAYKMHWGLRVRRGPGGGAGGYTRRRTHLYSYTINFTMKLNAGHIIHLTILIISRDIFNLSVYPQSYLQIRLFTFVVGC